MISGNKTINVTLLAIVIGLTAVTLFKPELLPSQRIERITKLDIDEVNTITINNAGQITELLRKGGEWFVYVDNRIILANNKNISNVLKFPQQQALAISDSSDEELAAYGLNDSELFVTYNDTMIKIGDSEPLAIRHYILSNNKVFVADDSLYRGLLLPATDFVSPFLIQPGQKVTNSKILWKRKPSIELPTVKDEHLYQNWQKVTAEEIQKYEGEETIAIILVQINYRTIVEFGIVPSKNTLKLVRKDLGVIYVVPRHYMTDLLVYSSSRFE